MMKPMKRLLSLFTAMMILICAIGVSAEDAGMLTAYVTVSYHGEIATTPDNQPAALLPVSIDAQAGCTLNEVFIALHERYLPDGYASSESEMGGYITKFWNDDSGNFGYQVNGEMPQHLYHPVENGDVIDVAVYQNYFPHTEAYTRFDRFTAEITTGGSVTLTLSESFYQQDEAGNWYTAFAPCMDATIRIDNESTDIVTSSDGTAELTFSEEGTYIVSAYKEKTITETAEDTTQTEKTVPAITAPVCVITVTEPEELTLIHNIAQKYSDTAIATDGNMIWLLCDLAVYNTVYPDNQIVLSDTARQSCLDTIIKNADTTSDASVLAKSILALRAMGYDAKTVYNELGQLVNLPAKLTALIDENSPQTDNVYALPYLILALAQSEDYATASQMEYLLQKVISKKADWQNDEWGTDAMSAMIPALIPYCSKPEIDALIPETLDLIAKSQSDTGLIGNAAATGLAMVAFSSAGTDPSTVICNEKTLIDGLLTQKSEEKNGFLPMDNSFSTEQGWRGLLACKLLQSGSSQLFFDFSHLPKNPAYCTKKSSPSGGGSYSGGSGGGSVVKVEKEEPKDNSKTEQDEQTEEQKQQEEKRTQITKKRNPDIKPNKIAYPEKTFSDITGHIYQKEIETLAQRGIINGKSEHSYDATASMTRAEFAALVTRALGLYRQQTTVFSDVTQEDWFFSYVNTAYHYGIIKGVSETSFLPNGTITRQEAAVMVSRAAKLCGLEASGGSARDILAAFTDYMSISSWATDAMAFCYEEGILSDADIEAHPERLIDRGEVADMIYRLLDHSFLLEENKSDETK